MRHVRDSGNIRPRIHYTGGAFCIMIHAVKKTSDRKASAMELSFTCFHLEGFRKNCPGHSDLRACECVLVLTKKL